MEDDITYPTSTSTSLTEYRQMFKSRLKNTNIKLNLTILNRRQKKLKEMLTSHDEFFSEDSIKQRDPILYEIYIGSLKRKYDIFNNTNNVNFINSGCSLTHFLINEFDREIHMQNLNKAYENEIQAYGERTVNAEYSEVSQIIQMGKESQYEDECDELIRLMCIRFLMGEDNEFFNYAECDNNEKYDDIEEMNRDAECEYFDEEEANECEDEENQTGIYDY